MTAHITMFSCRVADATQTFPSQSITVSGIADVNVAVTLTPHTSPTHYLWVAVETAGTPGELHKQLQEVLSSSDQSASPSGMLTSHSLNLCIHVGIGHTTRFQMNPGHRWD